MHPKYIKPLCKLLKISVEWEWQPNHEKCFKSLRKIVCKFPALVPLDPRKKIVLQCDASTDGLGCCMFQKQNFKTSSIRIL